MINNKRGISDVIATVLIILVTIVAAGALGAFLIPWVQENMGGATNCLDVNDKISFVQDSSCYFIKLDGTENYTQVRVKFGKTNISAMNLYVEIDGAVRAILIKDGAEVSSPRILNSSGGNILRLPPSNGERTYKFNNTIIKSIKVAAVVNGKTCDMSDYTYLDRCKVV